MSSPLDLSVPVQVTRLLEIREQVAGDLEARGAAVYFRGVVTSGAPVLGVLGFDLAGTDYIIEIKITDDHARTARTRL